MNKYLASAFQHLWDTASPRGVFGRVAALFLAPLSWGYCAVQKIRRSLYRRGILSPKRVVPLVISIGGIRAGGSGKTPFTCWLAKRLRDRGFRVAVLTRGYGRKGQGETMILTGSGEPCPDPDRCGDEPCLLAAALVNVPVVVDANRYRGAVYALNRFPVDIFLMDDGFQHLQLFRNLDIVLLPHGEDPDGLACMPRGPLREPASALQDADLRVRVCSGTRTAEGTRPSQTRLEKDVCLTEHTAVMEAGDLRTIDDNLPADYGSLAGKKVFAFCGIARPDAFWKTLQGKGIKINDRKVYPDHHRYTDRDYRTLMERMADVPFAVTTEKDAVKLKRFAWPPGKLFVLDIRPAISDEAAFWEQVDARLPADKGKNKN